MSDELQNSGLAEHISTIIRRDTHIPKADALKAAQAVIDDFGLTEVYSYSFDEEIRNPKSRRFGETVQRLGPVKSRRVSAEVEKERRNLIEDPEYGNQHTNFQTVARVEGRWRELHE